MTKKFLTTLNILTIFIFIGISGYVYYGFYFPDPTVLDIYWRVIYLQWAIKLFFPVITIALIFLYRSMYLKHIKFGSVILLFFIIFFLLLLTYPIADYIYKKSFADNIDELHSYLQINPQSLKINDPSEYNIFCLGGSTTEFKDSLRRDWPGLVEIKMKAKPQFQDVRLFNYGKQWYSTQHILINYELNLKPLKPNAIIVMENINDLLHNADFSWFSKGKYRDDYGNFLGPLTRIIKYGSFAEFIQKTISGLWYHNKTLEVETKTFPGLKAFTRNLNTIISLAEEDGTKIILMTQPNIYKDSMSVNEMKALHMLNKEAIGNGKQWSYTTVLNGSRQYNDRIREIALTRNVYLIDLEKIIPKNLEYFYDDVHYQSKTYDMISSYLMEELETIITH